MVRLHTFGGCWLSRDGERVEDLTGQRKALALLTLLATSEGKGVSRDSLLAQLWPDSDQDHARTSLKQLVRTLRTRLHAPEVVVGSADLRLDPSQLTADVVEFRSAVAQGNLEVAAALYAGPFLDGFFLRDADPFERWVAVERAALANDFTRALEVLAERDDAKGDPGAAVTRWRRLAAADPLNARATLGLMRALDRAGDRAAALQHARCYERLMREELDASPDPSVVALVRHLSSAGPAPPANRSAVAAPPDQLRTSPAPVPPGARRRSLRIGWAVAAAFALLTPAMLIIRAPGSGFRAAPSLIAAGTLNRSGSLLIADFETSAGTDPGLGRVLADLVRTDLGQSNAVTVVAAPLILAALERMQRPAGTPLGRSLAHEIAVREGIPAVIEGELASLGGEFVVTLRLVAAGGAQLTTVHATTSLAQLIPTLGGLTRQLRSRIGESLAAVRASPPLTQVTTPSLAALRKYVAGAHALDFERDYARAIMLLTEALTMDSSFASAWSMLARSYRLAGGMPRELADAADEQAYRHRNRLPEPERYAVLGTYFRSGPGNNRTRAAEALEAGLRLDTARFATDLGFLHHSRREYARAESLFQWQVRYGSSEIMLYAGLTNVLYAQGKREEAERVEATASRRTPPILSPGRVAFYLYNRGEFDSAQTAIESESVGGLETHRFQRLMLLSDLLVARGHLDAAAEARAQGADANRRRGGPDDSMGAELWDAWLDIWHRDRVAPGLRRLEAAIAAHPLTSLPLVSSYVSTPFASGEVYYLWVARLFAQANRPDRAREILRQFTADPRTASLDLDGMPALHALHGEIALAEGRPLDALVAFRRSDRLPDGPAHFCAICTEANLGRAFDQAGLTDSAIVSFERYFAVPQLFRIPTDAIYAARLARRLGELHEGKSDQQRAFHHYNRFLAQWRGADRELQPTVAEVRRRVEALRAVHH